jgi:glutaredoxin-related protein
MAMNPFVGKAKKALQNANLTFTVLDFGGYTGMWKQRLAIKMWSGWPTFPMVFVKGTLVGGASELQALIASGELQRMLRAGSSPA